MFLFGIASTILDILCFLVLWFILGYNNFETQTYFQTGWFIFGIISQTFIIYIIRTKRIPFIQSNLSKQLVFSTLIVIIVTLLLGFSNIAYGFDLVKLSISYLKWLIILIVIYVVIIQILKKIYIKVNKEWI